MLSRIIHWLYPPDNWNHPNRWLISVLITGVIIEFAVFFVFVGLLHLVGLA